MENKIYKVLDYTKGLIYQDLSLKEVCGVLQTLMMQPSPSFDVIVNNGFFTSDFIESETGQWKYDAQPRLCARE